MTRVTMFPLGGAWMASLLKGKCWTNADSLSNGDVSPTWAGMKKSGGVVEKEIVFVGHQDTISDRVSGLVMKESLAVVDIEVIEEELFYES